ncbi:MULTISPECIES: hypothetical protein [unclassified Ornithinimicrobium]|uniref:hypothetical protein n=1 Tax=unclassified Ornithinimicrobium TaxID=2615080 RepID=UPI0038554EB5
MRPRLRPWGFAALGTVLAAAITWVSVCVVVIARPLVDELQAVDAAYVIGPVEIRIDQALAIMDTGVAPVLLSTISVNPDTGAHYATEHCGLQTAAYRVECVLPEPYTTRGEARTLAAHVTEHDWSRVAVMTSTPHAARTRMLMERCLGDDVEVLVWTTDDHVDRSARAWAGSFVYESAAWVKAQVLRDC